MSNKQVIWLSLFLVVSLYIGGLCHALTAKSFPCKIICSSHRIKSRFRFFLHYNFLAAELNNYAQQVGEDPANWQQVKIEWLGKHRYVCAIHKACPNGEKSSFEFFLEDSGRKTYLNGSDLVTQK